MAAYSLRTSLLLAAFLGASGHVDPANGVSTSCDDILRFAFPDLCDLQVVQENITVRGLRLAYWRYSAANGTGSGRGKVPVLVSHGGPAWGHNYVLPFKQQACRGREVVFYDQVGCGLSAIPPEPRRTAPWLFTVDYYIEEVRALANALGWDAFHFIGHSWGTYVGQVYGLQHDPRLKGLVLAGPLSDPQLYIRSQWDRRAGSLGTLPFYTQHVLRKLDSLQAYDSPLYSAEDKSLTAFFTVRTVPTPDCFLTSAMNMLSKTSKEIYVGMQGASEFTMSGVMSALNLTGRLGQIPNPVLLVSGKFDTMRPPTVDAMYRNLPRAWWAEMPRSGHCTMTDDPQLTNNVVGEFLDGVESDSLGGFQAWIDKAVADSLDGPLESPAVAASALTEPAPRLPGVLQGLLLVALGVAVGTLAGPWLAPRYYVRRLWAEGARTDLTLHLSM